MLMRTTCVRAAATRQQIRCSFPSKIHQQQRHNATTAVQATRPDDKNFRYCMQSVRENDYEMYMSTLLTPTPLVRAAFAVRAFNIELLSIGKQRDINIGELKLQFWKDQLERMQPPAVPDSAVKVTSPSLSSSSSSSSTEIEREAAAEEATAAAATGGRLPIAGEPVSSELALVVRAHARNKAWLRRMVEARRHFLRAPGVATAEELERLADASLAPAYYALLGCASVQSVDCDHAASHVARAQLLCGVVRHMLRPRSQSVHYLPAELLAKHRVAQQDLLIGGAQLQAKRANLGELAFEVCTRANQHVASAQALADKVPREARALFAAVVPLRLFLERMQTHNFDLMDAKLAARLRATGADVPLTVRLMYAKLRNVYL